MLYRAVRCGRTAEFGATAQGKLARGLEVGIGLLGHGGLDLVGSRARATAYLVHGWPRTSAELDLWLLAVVTRVVEGIHLCARFQLAIFDRRHLSGTLALLRFSQIQILPVKLKIDALKPSFNPWKGVSFVSLKVSGIRPGSALGRKKVLKSKVIDSTCSSRLELIP
jgi:hypothetical protein